jgi:hypothetical protein
MARLLQNYVRGLSPRSRSNRLLGAASELPASEFPRALAANGRDTLTLLMTSTIAARERSAARPVALSCAERVGEFGMSIADDRRHLGAGSAMLQEIERKAAADGIELLFGDRSPTNAGMIGLARPRLPPRTGARTTPRANSEALGRRCPDLPCQKWSEIARGAE